MPNTPKKIAFFGTPAFTTQFLDALVENEFAPALVVTGPDKPVGRGHVVTKPVPAQWAQDRGVSVLQPEKFDSDFLKKINETQWDLFVVVAYGKILPEQLINMPRDGTINIHYSLLPHYRGATPVESAILNGDATTGVTIQQMKYELDSGDMLMTKEIPIDPNDTTPRLRQKLNNTSVPLLTQTISSIFFGTIIATPQAGGISICKKIKKEDGLVSLNDDPIALDRKFRAYQPWPGIYFDTVYRGAPLRVKIVSAHFDDGLFIIDEVIPENHKRMNYDTFQQFLRS